jgi:putative LysE/RhtB family amino acid efflux pump
MLSGVLLIVLAIAAERRPVHASTGTAPPSLLAEPRRLRASYLLTLGLTLANPVTILSFAAAIVGLGLTRAAGSAGAALVGGVFTGAAAWWLLFTSGLTILRARICDRTLERLRAVTSLLLGSVGFVAICSSWLSG